MTSGLVSNLLGTVTNFNIDIDKNNLSTIRRASENEEGISDHCHRSDHEVDEIESIDSQQSMTNFDDLSVDVLN